MQYFGVHYSGRVQMLLRQKMKELPTLIGTQMSTNIKSAEESDTRNIFVTLCIRLYLLMEKVTRIFPTTPKSSVNPYTIATGINSSRGMLFTESS